MKTLLSTAPLAAGIPSLLVLKLGFLQARVLELSKMDRRFEGKLEGNAKCVWLKDGRRVEFEVLDGGGFIASTSTESDPLYPGKESS